MRKFLEKIEGFSIFDLAPNPFAAVFWRELLTTLRQRRYGFILTGAAAVLIFYIVGDLGRMHYWLISPAMLISNVLTLQYSALLAFIFLVLPALAAVTLASERQQKTDDLLYTALFSPISLMAGKLFAVLGVFAAFHVAMLPLAAFIYFFAGIEVLSFFQIQFLLYGSAVLHTIVGLMASRLVDSPNRAVFLAYLFIIGIYGVPLGWAYYTYLQAGAAGTTAFQAPANPVQVVSDLLASAAGWRQCLVLLGWQSLGTLMVTLLSLGYTYLQSIIVTGWSRVPTGRRRQRPTQGPIPDWINAVYLKDVRTHPSARLVWGACLFLIAAGLSYAFNHWSARALDFNMSGLDAGAIAVYVLVPFLVIESCNYEMAPGNLVLLRMTNLGSDRVLAGKALAVYRVLLPILAGIVAGTAAIVLVRGLPGLNLGPQPGQSMLSLIYQGGVLFPKVALAVALCFAFSRFRAPGPADLATNIALTGVFLAMAEAISYGLFQNMLSHRLDFGAVVIIAIGHLISLSFSVVIAFALAQMRFEAVFDEGSDVYAITHVDRRNF